MSLFDFFWRGTGGDTANIIRMDKNMSANIENIFGFPMKKHSNKTVSLSDFSIKSVSKETINKIRKNHKRFYNALNIKV